RHTTSKRDWSSDVCSSDLIIAGSYSDIFYMNCTKNAMLPIVLDENEREYIVETGEVTVDLPNQTVTAGNKQFHFDIDESWKNKLDRKRTRLNSSHVSISYA